MYPQFFGFQKLPFRLRPDPDFLYSGQEYRRARAGVLAALRGNTRVVLVMGQPGVGKTLLLDDVLQEIAGQFSPCRINQPHISATELLQALSMQLGTEPVDADANNARLFNTLIAALDAQGLRESPPLLIVDDAQLLAGATLVMLGDIMARAPRLKVLLVGQNDREKRGGGLNARIVREQQPQQVMMPPLGAEGAKAYIEHRLRVAGSAGKDLFTADAYGMIFQQTGGAARLINVLCDAALHAACLRASGHVSSAEVLAATQDSRWPEALARARARPVPVEFPSVAVPPPVAAAAVDTETAPAAPAPPPDAKALPAAKTAAAALVGVAAAQVAPATAVAATAVPITPAAAVATPAVPITPVASVAAAAPVASVAPVAAAAAPVARAAPAAVPVPVADAESFSDTCTQVDTGGGPARAAPSSPQLLLSHGREHIATCALEPGRISIGRASDNIMRLDAPIISRHHCQIVTVGPVSTVEDLGSVNGISVNGKLVKRHVLEHADQIMVGDYVLTFVAV